MELTKMTYFACVAVSDNMQIAAESMNVSQSTLSMAVKQLEQELGVELFRKSGRRLVLTEAGYVFLQDATQILNQVEQAKAHAAQFRSVREARLQIITEAPDFSAEASVLFRKRHPEVRDVQQLVPRHAVKPLLHTGRADFAITVNDLSDDMIESTLVLHEPMLLSVGSEHWLYDRQSLALAEIAGEPLVLLPEQYGYHMVCQECFDLAGVRITEVHEVSAPELIPRAVRSGFGVGPIPRSAYLQQKTHDSVLHALDITAPEWVSRVYLTRLRRQPLTPLAQEMFDHIARFGELTTRNGRYPTTEQMKEG